MRSTSTRVMLAAAVAAGLGSLAGMTASMPPRAPRRQRKPVASMPVDQSEIAQWNAKVDERKAAKRARQAADLRQWGKR